jgi:ABC-type nitrate/sulfonate/bicarbonate transport system ATPase subunit
MCRQKYALLHFSRLRVAASAPAPIPTRCCSDFVRPFSSLEFLLSFVLRSVLVPRVSELSGGLRMRVALCMAFIIEPDLLLLDEPTNHLDFPSVLWLENRLRGYKVGAELQTDGAARCIHIALDRHVHVCGF